MTVHFFKRLQHSCTGRQRGSPLQIERSIWRTAGPNPLVPCTEPCRYSNGSSKIIVAVCQPFLPFRFFCAFHCTFLAVKRKQLQQQKPDNRQQNLSTEETRVYTLVSDEESSANVAVEESFFNEIVIF